MISYAFTTAVVAVRRLGCAVGAAAVALMLCSGPAYAADGAPEFLLGDLGVRVDLPRDWKMTRWSDWDFKGEKKDGSVLLFAWATPVQTPIAGEATDWGPVYLDKVEELKGEEPMVKGGQIASVRERDTAYVDVSFKFGSGDGGVLYGATTTIAGQMFHMAFVTAERRAKGAETARDDIMKRLDIQPSGVATETKANAQLEAKGIQSTLPDGWREPLKSEMAQAMKATTSFGIDDITDCWLAVKPLPASGLDVMVTCQGGLLLGVVDEYSYEGVDEVVRQKMFGQADVPAAEKIEISDRLGFLYAPPLGSRSLVVGVVPYDQGVARTWAVGGAEDPSIAAAVREVISGASYSGEHPASLGDRFNYYITYRPFSPVVLCPALGLLGLVGLVLVGGVMVMRGRRDKYADLMDD